MANGEWRITNAEAQQNAAPKQQYNEKGWIILRLFNQKIDRHRCRDTFTYHRLKTGATPHVANPQPGWRQNVTPQPIGLAGVKPCYVASHSSLCW